MQRLAAHWRRGARGLYFIALFHLYNEADRKTGLTAMSHKHMGKLLGCHEKHAQKIMAKLVKDKHIGVVRRRIGNRSDGAAVFGAHGGVSVYNLLVAEEAESTAPMRCNEARSTADLRCNEAPQSDPDSTASQFSKHRISTPHTLYPLNSPKNPYDFDALTSGEATWLSVKDVLTHRFGTDVCKSWFDKLKLGNIADGIVTLIAPTRFLQSRVTNDYLPTIEEAWKHEQPQIERVRLVVPDQIRTAAE